MEPTTGYASIADQGVAYSVLGDAPIDVIFTFGFWGSFDVEWEDPGRCEASGLHTLKGFDGQWKLYSVMQGTG